MTNRDKAKLNNVLPINAIQDSEGFFIKDSEGFFINTRDA